MTLLKLDIERRTEVLEDCMSAVNEDHSLSIIRSRIVTILHRLLAVIHEAGFRAHHVYEPSQRCSTDNQEVIGLI